MAGVADTAKAAGGAVTGVLGGAWKAVKFVAPVAAIFTLIGAATVSAPVTIAGAGFGHAAGEMFHLAAAGVTNSATTVAGWLGAGAKYSAAYGPVAAAT